MADPGAGSAATQSGQGPGGGADEPIPFLQRVLDNPFLLLFLGVVIPAVSYVIWGIMEVVSIPVAH